MAFGRETPDPMQTSFSQGLQMGAPPMGGAPVPGPAHNGGTLPSQYTVMMAPDEDMPDASASIAGMEAVSSRPATETRYTTP